MINNYPLVNIYEKSSLKSKLSSQLLYGEKFKVIKKKNGWLLIDKPIGVTSNFVLQKVRKVFENGCT